METAPAREELKTWVNNVSRFCEADFVHWCDGSKEEYDRLCKLLVDKGTFIPLNPEKDRIVSPVSATPVMWPG